MYTNILFICGSLELGKDGVGDYTRHLAKQLIQFGNSVSIIAINDKHINDIINETLQKHIAVPTLRLPKDLSWSQKKEEIVKFVRYQRPDWVSLQYVPFSFHTKGLCFGLSYRLKSSIKDVQWQIMFHELWCGMAKKSTLKEKVLGFGQKIVLKNTVTVLKPKKIFTSTVSYKERLESIKIKNINVIPIFGNISHNALASDEKWKAKIDQQATYMLKSSDTINIGFFGSIYSNCELEDLFLHISGFARKKGLNINIIQAGVSKNIDILKRASKTIKANLIEIGEQDEDILNRLFTHIKIAVSTTPAEGIDKSGSAAAWLERSIPILISSSDTSYKSNELEKKGLFQVLSQDDIERAMESRRSREPESRLPYVAKFYVDKLTILNESK